jgi:hypothetical protein
MRALAAVVHAVNCFYRTYDESRLPEYALIEVLWVWTGTGDRTALVVSWRLLGWGWQR